MDCFPHPNSHYHPFTTNAFMTIRVIATGVANYVKLKRIHLLRIGFLLANLGGVG